LRPWISFGLSQFFFHTLLVFVVLESFSAVQGTYILEFVLCNFLLAISFRQKEYWVNESEGLVLPHSASELLGLMLAYLASKTNWR
jgi:hypothetical protein